MIPVIRMLRLLVLITLGTVSLTSAAEEFAVTGTVNFPETGSLVVALITQQEFNARALRPDNPYVLTLKPDPQQTALRQAVFTFRHVPPGQYSVGCFQDVNGNAQFDVNLFGFPTEPWGVYQLPRPVFMFPQFETVSFSVLTEITNLQLEIR